MTKTPQIAFNTADTAHASGERAAIYIPFEGADISPLNFVGSFNDISHSPPSERVGQIQDLKRFGKPIISGQEINEDVVIKTSGTGFYIPPQYEQFIPEIKQMIDHHRKNHGNDGVCVMTVRQGITQPDDSIKRGFRQAHKDLNLDRISNGSGAPNSLVMTASDTLPTGCSNYTLSVADQKKLATSDDPDKTLGEILNQDRVKFKTFEPGSITAFRATTVHALGNPDTPTQRTALLLAFHPKGEEAPPILNNPWLQSAMERNTASNASKLET
jgi:hypothetical protein